MDKVYTRIYWKNESESQTTPLGATNLNTIDYALDAVDDRVVALDTTKANEADALTMIADVSYNEQNGQFTFTRKNGQQIIADLNIEKIPVSFSLSENGILTMVTTDGSIYTADIASIIPKFRFSSTDTIGVMSYIDESTGETVYIPKLVLGSIDGKYLNPDYLASIEAKVNEAQTYATQSGTNATAASESATSASTEADRAYAEAERSKQYADEAKAVVHIDIATTEVAGIVKPDGTSITVEADGTIHAQTGTTDYSALTSKPKINGVELVGDKSTEDLLIEASSIKNYDTLDEALADATLSDGAYFSTEEEITETSPTILDTIEDIRNNTTENQIAGALALKEVDAYSREMGNCEVLYEGTTNEATYTLPKSFNEFRYIIFAYSADIAGIYVPVIYPVHLLNMAIEKGISISMYGYGTSYTRLNVVNDTTFTRHGVNGAGIVYYIYGIK